MTAPDSAAASSTLPEAHLRATKSPAPTAPLTGSTPRSTRSRPQATRWPPAASRPEVSNASRPPRKKGRSRMGVSAGTSQPGLRQRAHWLS